MSNQLSRQEILKKAKIAANSWDNQKSVEKVESIQKQFNQATQDLSAERWPINPMVHYNEWANFTPDEFDRLQKAFFTLLEKFECSECSNWIYVSPSKGNIEEVRCECSEFQLNLNKKR